VDQGDWRAVQCALICPAYVGFYSVPIRWFSKVPELEVWYQADTSKILTIVLEGQLAARIAFRVRRDGFIWFDCNRWEPGAYTEIPGYERIPGAHIPKEVTAAEKVAEERAYNHSMLINAYQLCLNTAHVVKRHTAVEMSAPVQPKHLVHLTNFENPISLIYGNSHDPYCRYVDSVLKEIFGRGKSPVQDRRLVEHDVLVYSFELLDKIMASVN
jgi:hypothetical protein